LRSHAAAADEFSGKRLASNRARTADQGRLEIEGAPLFDGRYFHATSEARCDKVNTERGVLQGL
jgi:hypothetical protein